MIAVASVGPPEDLPRYKKTPMTGGLFKFMVVGGGLEPSARGFSECLNRFIRSHVLQCCLHDKMLSKQVTCLYCLMLLHGV